MTEISNRICFVFMVSVMALLTSSPAYAKSPAITPDTVAALPDVKFETRKIQLGGQIITIEIADTDAKRERGLMFRESLPDGHGMLFVFEDERKLSFWMKNTLIPLSIGYFDKNRRLNEVHEMVPAVLGERELKTYSSRLPAMYALEMPKGWYSKHRIKSGTAFTFVRKP